MNKWSDLPDIGPEMRSMQEDPDYDICKGNVSQ